MDDRDLANMPLQNHFTAAGALTALQMRHMLEEVRARVADAISNRTGHIERRTRQSRRDHEFVDRVRERFLRGGRRLRPILI